MRILCTMLLISGMSFAQRPRNRPVGSASHGIRPDSPRAVPSSNSNTVTIPAGTKIPLSLKQAISTKNAREGDAVYAETAFPFVINDHVIVPAGSYISRKHRSRGAGRAWQGSRRDPDALHIDDLSQWIHRDAPGFGREHARGG